MLYNRTNYPKDLKKKFNDQAIVSKKLYKNHYFFSEYFFETE